MEEQTQYHVALIAREKIEENTFHSIAVNGVLPTLHGNPDGFRMYRDSKIPSALVVATLEEKVAQDFYDELKQAMPQAYIVPPTKYVVKE